jgi:hypothetical protein
VRDETCSRGARSTVGATGWGLGQWRSTGWGFGVGYIPSYFIM